MAGKMKLYWFPLHRSMRINWLIKEMGVEGDFEMIKYKPNSNPPVDQEYRKNAHPMGTVPALEIPGRAPLLESGAMCMYLADKYGKLVPDTKDRADYYDFVMFGNSTLDEIINFYYDMWAANKEFSEEQQKNMRQRFDTAMDYMARRLEGRQYLCGNSLTAADCVVGYVLMIAEILKDGELLKKHPKIREYYARLKARPAYQETLNME